jgi:hypothetical protein
MIRKYNGELEIDTKRGVIYFHLGEKKDIEKLETMTILRICQLPKDNLIEANFIDITKPEKICII